MRIRVRISSKTEKRIIYQIIQIGEIFTWEKDWDQYHKTFQMQIDPDAENNVNQSLFLYNIKPGYLYEFNKNSLLTYLSGILVPLSNDEFNEVLTESLIETNTTHEFPYANLNELTRQKVLSEDLIEIFSLLKEEDITISNKSFDNIYVRIHARTLGSSNFFIIKSNCKKIWRRIPGEYLVEFVTELNISYRFLIKTSKNYEFTNEKNLYLIENNNNNNIYKQRNNKIMINQVYDLFNHHLKIRKFDKEKGELEEFEIIYEENKLELNSFIKPKIPYFNNELPDFNFSLEKSEKNEGKFVDKFFPPTKSQILSVEEKTGIDKKPHFRHLAKQTEFLSDGKKFEYKRPSEIFQGKKYKLFLDDINCDDAKQGILGNCYLISIIAALSQRIDLINKIFKTKTINENGFYELFYYDQFGTKKIIFVDDYFPFVDLNDGAGLQLLGTIPNGEEIWVMLMEKAYVKYEGGWTNIEGGTITSELEFFTGCNCKNIELTCEYAWQEILNACKRDNIICCRSRNDGKNHNFTSKNNIAKGHAYSILNAKEYKGLMLVKVRNPWGEIEWKGDYCDDSDLWTKELKEYFEFYEGIKEDGIFWMKFDDFIKEFFDLVICYC